MAQPTRPTLPLRLTQDGFGRPTLVLGGIDITSYVAADGLRIEYGDFGPSFIGGVSVPEVVIRFAPGRLNLDFDIELLEQLLTDAKAKVDR